MRAARHEHVLTCVMPRRVSSCMRLMMYGFFRNLSLNSFTVTGKVAE